MQLIITSALAGPRARHPPTTSLPSLCAEYCISGSRQPCICQPPPAHLHREYPRSHPAITHHLSASTPSLSLIAASSLRYPHHIYRTPPPAISASPHLQVSPGLPRRTFPNPLTWAPSPRPCSPRAATTRPQRVSPETTSRIHSCLVCVSRPLHDSAHVNLVILP